MDKLTEERNKIENKKLQLINSIENCLTHISLTYDDQKRDDLVNQIVYYTKEYSSLSKQSNLLFHKIVMEELIQVRSTNIVKGED